jgi:hypothetical protein
MFCVLLAAEAQADPFERLRLWSGEHALTLPKARTELGLFSDSRYGLTERIEVALHPLLFFVLPHAQLKVRALTTGFVTFACRSRISYPTWFFERVSREGSGGLLPDSSEPPEIVQIEGDAIATALIGSSQLASFFGGLAVAPHESFTPEQLALLDFPFLYPRFAPVYSVFVPRAALAFEGPLLAKLHYAASARAYLMPQLPDVGTTYALEQAISLEYRFERFAVSLGTRVSEAKYPVGFRVHYLPHLGARGSF